MDFVGFNRRSGALGVKIKKEKNRKKYYYATPLTDVSNAHHFPKEEKKGGSSVAFHMVNIRGLVTKGITRFKR